MLMSLVVDETIGEEMIKEFADKKNLQNILQNSSSIGMGKGMKQLLSVPGSKYVSFRPKDLPPDMHIGSLCSE